MKAFLKQQWPKLLLVFLAAVFYLVTTVTGFGCIYKHFFGVPCPGCGFSHAVLSLLKLDFAAAFRYHPMIWSLPFLAVFFLFGDKIQSKALVYTMVLIVAGFFVTWIIRLL